MIFSDGGDDIFTSHENDQVGHVYAQWTIHSLFNDFVSHMLKRVRSPKQTATSMLDTRGDRLDTDSAYGGYESYEEDAFSDAEVQRSDQELQQGTDHGFNEAEVTPMVDTSEVDVSIDAEDTSSHSTSQESAAVDIDLSSADSADGSETIGVDSAEDDGIGCGSDAAAVDLVVNSLLSEYFTEESSTDDTEGAENESECVTSLIHGDHSADHLEGDTVASELQHNNDDHSTTIDIGTTSEPEVEQDLTDGGDATPDEVSSAVATSIGGDYDPAAVRAEAVGATTELESADPIATNGDGSVAHEQAAEMDENSASDLNTNAAVTIELDDGATSLTSDVGSAVSEEDKNAEPSVYATASFDVHDGDASDRTPVAGVDDEDDGTLHPVDGGSDIVTNNEAHQTEGDTSTASAGYFAWLGWRSSSVENGDDPSHPVDVGSDHASIDAAQSKGDSSDADDSASHPADGSSDAATDNEAQSKGDSSDADDSASHTADGSSDAATDDKGVLTENVTGTASAGYFAWFGWGSSGVENVNTTDEVDAGIGGSSLCMCCVHV